MVRTQEQRTSRATGPEAWRAPRAARGEDRSFPCAAGVCGICLTRCFKFPTRARGVKRAREAVRAAARCAAIRRTRSPPPCATTAGARTIPRRSRARGLNGNLLRGELDRGAVAGARRLRSRGKFRTRNRSSRRRRSRRAFAARCSERMPLPGSALRRCNPRPRFTQSPAQPAAGSSHRESGEPAGRAAPSPRPRLPPGLRRSGALDDRRIHCRDASYAVRSSLRQAPRGRLPGVAETGIATAGGLRLRSLVTSQKTLGEP